LHGNSSGINKERCTILELLDHCLLSHFLEKSVLIASIHIGNKVLESSSSIEAVCSRRGAQEFNGWRLRALVCNLLEKILVKIKIAA
jgi:hypothetical protein